MTEKTPALSLLLLFITSERLQTDSEWCAVVCTFASAAVRLLLCAPAESSEESSESSESSKFVETTVITTTTAVWNIYLAPKEIGVCLHHCVECLMYSSSARVLEQPEESAEIGWAFRSVGNQRVRLRSSPSSSQSDPEPGDEHSALDRYDPRSGRLMRFHEIVEASVPFSNVTSSPLRTSATRDTRLDGVLSGELHSDEHSASSASDEEGAAWNSSSGSRRDHGRREDEPVKYVYHYGDFEFTGVSDKAHSPMHARARSVFEEPFDPESDEYDYAAVLPRPSASQVSDKSVAAIIFRSFRLVRDRCTYT